ncbi:MAG: discoidin domain-containing protein [Clostridia bacterium]|nr:discoidin domain-containing protein [Clostridia bacterium]
MYQQEEETGKIYDGTIYGSEDGENWEVLCQKKNLTYTNQANTNEQAMANTKSFDIEEPKQVQYVKIVADRTNGNWFAARAFNLYQDKTQNPHPTAGIGFSITEPTNTNVVARLINPSTDITITNNGGSDTYTFEDNGEFTFEFVDNETGVEGSAKAKVDWIDKVAPTATIEYNIETKTNGEVIAKLIPSEEVTVLNNGKEVEDNGLVAKAKTVDENSNPNQDPFTYTFMENRRIYF